MIGELVSSGARGEMSADRWARWASGGPSGPTCFRGLGLYDIIWAQATGGCDEELVCFETRPTTYNSI